MDWAQSPHVTEMSKEALMSLMSSSFDIDCFFLLSFCDPYRFICGSGSFCDPYHFICGSGSFCDPYHFICGSGSFYLLQDLNHMAFSFLQEASLPLCQKWMNLKYVIFFGMLFVVLCNWIYIFEASYKHNWFDSIAIIGTNPLK